MIDVCVMGCMSRYENLKFRDEDECVSDVYALFSFNTVNWSFQNGLKMKRGKKA